MAQDVTQQAVDAFFLTLADSLPAALAARDATRFAVLRLRAGPYALGAGGSLHVNGEVFALTGGSRTATQVAAELAGAVSFAASVETEGAVSRLVLTAVAAPAEDAPSELVIDEASTEGVLTGLGLRPDQRQVELATASPEPRLLPTQPEGIFRLGGAPLIYLEDAVAAEHFGGGPKERIWRALLRLQVWVPASGHQPGEAALEKAMVIQRGIHDVLRAGDSYSPYHVGGQAVGQRVVQARPTRLLARARLFDLAGEAVTGGVAIVTPEVEILVADRTA